jgi:hypothetical protein
MSEPADQWPPPGMSLPIYDEEDLHAFGWEGGTASDGEYAGCTFLQTGQCGDHSAIIFRPGGRIICDENGCLKMENVSFTGHGPLHHDHDCLNQRPPDQQN